MADETSEIDVEDKYCSLNSIVLPLRDKKEGFTFRSVEGLDSFIETERSIGNGLQPLQHPGTCFQNILKHS